MNWPLPLTPIEELFFTDDRPAYPSCCFLRAGFSGCFDPGKLEATIRATIQRHPLLTAKVERRGSGLVWVPAEKPLPSIVWQVQPGPDGFPPAVRIDLLAEMGIRFLVHQHDSGSALYIQFHHAVCDGVGIFQLLHEILLGYAGSRESSVAQKPGLDLERWDRARRGVFALPIAKQLVLATRHFMNLWSVLQFVRKSPSALRPHPAEPHDGAPAGDYPAATTVRLTSEETTALQNAAGRLRVTVNDLLLRDLFMAVHEWRKSQDIHGSNQCLRLAVPVNLRAPGEHDVPVSNILSMVFLDRCDLNFDDPNALLRGVSHEMKRHKQRHMGQILPLALALGRNLPGGLKKHIWANKCLVSSLLSNLGKLFENSPLRGACGRLVVGNVTLHSVEVLPPVRPHMQAAFVVGTYAGQLWATLRYDLRALSRAQAHDLMSHFHRRVLSSRITAE